MDKREALCEMGYEDAVVFDNPEYDDAIIGVSVDGNVVYEYDAMVEVLHQRGMTWDAAVDFLEYNTIRSIPYARADGAIPPIVIHLLPDE